jgi:hypothetical protein
MMYADYFKNWPGIILVWPFKLKPVSPDFRHLGIWGRLEKKMPFVGGLVQESSNQPELSGKSFRSWRCCRVEWSSYLQLGWCSGTFTKDWHWVNGTGMLWDKPALFFLFHLFLCGFIFMSFYFYVVLFLCRFILYFICVFILFFDCFKQSLQQLLHPSNHSSIQEHIWQL